MWGSRATVSVVLLALAGASAVAVAAPPAYASGGDDVAVIGDRVAASSSYKYLAAGPAAGAPTATVDAASSTVTVAFSDAALGDEGTITMAWPARAGTWALGPNGADPEQTVRLTRRLGGTDGCTFMSGTLTLHRAEATPTGGVAALSADLEGVCSLSSGGFYTGAQVRIGDADPSRAVSVPRAQPASLVTGALAGTVVTREVTVTNAGSKPWKVGAAATASSSSRTPRFTVAPAGNQCSGVTLAAGESCSLQVTATATNYRLDEYLLVGGDSQATLVVPLVLEGYDPVVPPSAATAVAGRLSATVSWQPPATLPRVGYRVYDVTGGGRSLLASAPASASEVNVPTAGARRLAVVAANGRFAESTDAVVDLPVISSEVVGNDWYGRSVAVATSITGAPARPLGVDRVDLDPSRSTWVTAGGSDVRVCPVATEQCVTVPGTPNTVDPDADSPREAVWLPDGTIAFLRGYSERLRTLWAVRPDGSGLRKVATLPNRAQLAAAPSGTEVVVQNFDGFGRLERVRLSDGRFSPIAGTESVDDFTITNRGQLVLERRVDPSSTNGPRTTTVANLDGSGARRLALPAGDNREVTFDPSGSQVAFARYTGDWEATMWVAAADGTGARQLSTASTGWINLKWSVDDQLAPTASIAVSGYTTRNTTVSIGAADGDDSPGSLRRQCRLDGSTAWSVCGSTLTLTGLTTGTHTVQAQVTDPSGRQSAVVSRSWVVDAAAPTTTLTTPAAVQTGTPTTLTWTAGDTGGSALAGYDVRTRTAAPGSGFGAYQYPSSWQNLASRSLTAALSAGYQYCFAVRARDRAGNVGAWSTERCTSMPLDDRGLAASSGWVRGSSSSYLFSTYSRTVKSGAQLTRTGVSGRRLALVATTCVTCGSVDVYHAGVKLGRVNLYSSSTKGRQILWLPLQPVTRTGTVVIRSTGTRQVVIDGLAIAH